MKSFLELCKETCPEGRRTVINMILRRRGMKEISKEEFYAMNPHENSDPTD